MATATGAGTAEVVGSAGDQCVVLRGIDWAGYTELLRLRGERPLPKVLYLDGVVSLMSPSLAHERLRTRLGWFVMVVAWELKIPFLAASQTTFRDEALGVGLEGDEAYYLAHEPFVRGKGEIDLRTDPPPDLAVEAVHTHGAAKAVVAYGRLGVPEVWVCDGSGLQVLRLVADGAYVASGSSLAFPFLTAEEIFGWVGRPHTSPDVEWLDALRLWVREELAGRLPRPEAGGEALP